MRKIFTSIFLTIALSIFALNAISALAEENIWDGKVVATGFAGGTGTSSSPYQIETCAQLSYMASLLTSTDTKNWTNYGTKYYILTADLNLNGYSFNGIENFSGNFNGNNHIISGINVKTNSSAGLFLSCSKATIKNLTVSGQIIGKQNVGGIAGRVSDCTISNCVNKCTIIADTTISELFTTRFGGIVGRAYYSSGTTTITNCTNKGKIETKSNTGGIVGEISDIHTSNVSGGYIIVEYCKNEGYIQGTSNVGGIVGVMTGGTVRQCANVGTVSGTGSHIGGIAGDVGSKAYGSFAKASVLNCYNVAEISGDNYVSGVVGYAYGNRGDSVSIYSTLKNLYNKGKVIPISGKGTSGTEVGGYIEGSTTVSNLYYLDGINTAANLKVKEAQVALSDEQMKSESNFSGFSFSQSYWGWDSGGTYPYPIIKKIGVPSVYICSHISRNTKQENVVNSTCSAVGSCEEVSYCNDCGIELSRTAKRIDKLSHTRKDSVCENIVAANCTNPTYFDEVFYCVDCNAEIERTAKTSGNPLGHTIITDEEIVPTCINNGLTQGSHCKVCNVILVSQEIIPALDHTYENITIQWGDEYKSAVASGICKCSHELTQECSITVNDEMLGKKVITATSVFNDMSYTDTVELVENTLKINGETSVEIGSDDKIYNMEIITVDDVYAAYFSIQFPDTFSLKSVNAKDFAYAGLEDEYTEDGFTTAVILAQYSETDLIPKNVIHTPFELTFDVSKSATPGVVQIEATEESCLIGNDTYFFEEKIPGTLEILPKLAESVEITGADVISAEATYTAIVSPDYTTNKAVVWSVSDEAIATVSENGIVTPVTSGTITLTATATDGSGVSATKTVTVTRSVTRIDIVGIDSITEATTYFVNIMPDYATNKEVEWSISNAEIASVDQNGRVTPITSGLVTITVTAKDGSGIFATKEINIIKLAESIEITGEDSISSPAQYTATVAPDYTSDKDVEWSVDNEEIATVDELGIVTPVTSGTITLTATAKDGSGIAATKTIEIIKLAESIEIIGSEEITEPSQYSVVILPEYTTNKAAEWSVSDETIATVNENGVVTPLKNGKIVLTAKALDASGIETTKSIVITVSVRANSITSDIGVWDKEFDSDITEYTINVPVGTTAIYLTSSFTNATAKVNGSIAANGMRKKVSLTGNETDIKLVLTPTSGNNLSANTYKITVICGSFTKTTVSDDGKSFSVVPFNIESGKAVILALYDGDTLVEMQKAVYTGEAVTFTTNKTYTNAKVMVWDDLTILKPVCDVEEIN